MPIEPEEYDDSPDKYFRPWKVHKDLSKIIGQKKYGAEAVEKAKANKDFLKKTAKALKSSMDTKTKLQELFWASTNITGLLEVEAYWPHATAGQRTALIKRANTEMIQKLEQLSSWVWEERSLTILENMRYYLNNFFVANKQVHKVGVRTSNGWLAFLGYAAGRRGSHFLIDLPWLKFQMKSAFNFFSS